MAFQNYSKHSGLQMNFEDDEDIEYAKAEKNPARNSSNAINYEKEDELPNFKIDVE